ncbi:MAG: SpaA isopeptide-forming pilin-related protein, partial [Peptostreptococcaceae bacterium]|nr:SpaA isopeptide-forming pilin-related protein [Peptostreptococcaceae bacterium]
MLNGRNKKLSLISYFMAMLLITNIFIPYGSSYAADLGLHDLIVKNVIIRQSGEVAENGHLDSDTSVIVSADLSAQIGPGKIQKNDHLSFKISENFDPQDVAPISIEVENGTYTLGTYTLSKKSDGLYADIIFDGNVFEATDIKREEGIATIPFWLTAVMNYDHSSGAIDHSGKQIQIIEKNYILDPSKGDFAFKMEKTGDASGKTPQVWWTVQITPSKDGSLAHLDGFRFEDNVGSLGGYEADTFQIDGTKIEPVYNNNVLSYTFPDGFGKGSATITFATKIVDRLYHGTNTINYTNRAYLYSKFEGKAPTFVESKPARFTPNWISKNGEEADKGSTGVITGDANARYIKWTITANGNEASLRNMYVEDVLSQGLELHSAKYKEWIWDQEPSESNKEGKGHWGPEKDPRIVGDKYYIGEEGHVNNKKILLTLITTATNIPQNHSGENINFQNQATLGWDNSPGIKTQPVEATIGFNKIKKTALPRAKSYTSPSPDEFVTNPQTTTIAWQTDVDLKDELPPDTKVYEVFLYNDNGYMSSDLQGIPAGLTFGPEGTRTDKDPLNRPTAIKQKFSGFKSDHGLTHEVTPITDKSGNRVGDLLTIKGFKKDQKATYFTTSTVVSTAMHYKISNNFNSDKEAGWHQPVFSTAKLYSGSKELTQSTSEGLLPYHSIYKEALHHDAVKNPTATKSVNDPKANSHFSSNGYILSANEYHLAFDYEEKAMIFRISINPNNEDYTKKQYFDEKTQTLQTYEGIEVSDHLMPGWEFVPFDKKNTGGIENHQYFLMYEGTNGISPDARTYVGSITEAVPPADMTLTITDGSLTTRSTATFNFPTLKRSYVILLKAKPSEEKMKELFTVQKDYGHINGVTYDEPYLNSLFFKLNGYSGKEKPVRLNARTALKSSPLSKQADLTKQKDGSITWSVDYKLDGFSATDIHLLDTLPAGIDIPMDAQGQIILESNGQKTFKITELKPTADGKYVVNTEAAPIEITQDQIGPGKMIEYNNTTRELTFRAPEDKKAYRFEYRTDITTQNVGKIVNKAKLSGSGNAQASSSASAFIASIAAGASVERGGLLNIKKVAPNNQALANAEFKLLTQNGTPFREGVTNAQGDLEFRVLPVGTYTLKETAAPSGYILNAKTYTVEVKLEGKKYVTSIKDGNQDLGNTITVVNHPQTIAPKPTGSLLVDNQVYKVKGSTETPVTDVKFDYKVVFTGNGSSENYTYEKTDSNGTKSFPIKNGDIVSLKHGENFIINGLPEGLQVTVTETVVDGYTVTPAKEQSKTITITPRQEIHFINKITEPDNNPPGGGGNSGNVDPKGHLEVSNKIYGKDADTSKNFKYVVTFEGNGSDSTYNYTKFAKDGSVLETNTIQTGGTFELTDGERFLISDMPPGLKVTVVEDKDVAGDYEVDPASKTIEKTIEANNTVYAPFTNTREIPLGNVKITNEIINTTTPDKTKDFNYTVTFTGNGSDGEYSFTKIKVDPNTGEKSTVTGKIRTGENFDLKHGESFTIEGMPPGLRVDVEQVAYNDYKTTASIQQYQIITANQIQFIPFMNEPQVNSGGNSGGGNNPNPSDPGNNNPGN